MMWNGRSEGKKERRNEEEGKGVRLMKWLTVPVDT